jgi:hypothetical protein
MRGIEWSYDEDGFALNPCTGQRFKWGEAFMGQRFNVYRQTIKLTRNPQFKSESAFHANNSLLRPCRKGPCRSQGTVSNNLFKKARNRAQEKGLPFSLTLAWVKEQLSVAVARNEVVLATQGNGSKHPRSASIDRMIPCLGYTESNCRIIPIQLNMAKGEWDDDSFLDVVGAEVDRLRAQKRMKFVHERD